MLIHGLQKMTLLDFPGRVACTVFLAGCDWRCPFCHNYELAVSPSAPVMTSEEFLSFLKGRKGLLDGVAVTGGEPCLKKELPGFLTAVRDAGFSVKLDTNGCHPDMLRNILNNSLADYVAMDIKNSPEKYALTVGLPEVDLSPVRESVHILMECAPDYEFRTTLVDELHTADDIRAIGEWIRGARRCFLQAFHDRDSVPFADFHAPKAEIMRQYVSVLREYVPETQLRGVD